MSNRWVEIEFDARQLDNLLYLDGAPNIGDELRARLIVTRIERNATDVTSLGNPTEVIEALTSITFLVADPAPVPPRSEKSPNA